MDDPPVTVPAAALPTPITAAVRLYSPWQIGLAAFIGAPFAGCWFLARNYLHLGKRHKAFVCLTGGVLATAALIALWEFAPPLPDRFPALLVALAYSLVLQRIAHSVHGEALRRHLSAGGRLGSWWLVVGLSLLVLGALFLFIFGTVFFLPED